MEKRLVARSHPFRQPLPALHGVFGKFLVAEFKPRDSSMLKELQHLCLLRSK